MTAKDLQQAIEHTQQVANSCTETDCAEDHQQLAEWLRELVKLRKGPRKPLNVACPYCHANVGERCIRSVDPKMCGKPWRRFTPGESCEKRKILADSAEES